MGDVLPMSPNLRSSKRRKCFRLEISCSAFIVSLEKSSMMSACVLRTQIESPTSSASWIRSWVVCTSAETQRLERLIEIRLRR